MMDYPNMITEVLDAIHETYVDYPDVEADCLLYLASLRDNLSRSMVLANWAEEALDKMERCRYCGEPLQLYCWSEVHDELDEKSIENCCELYCPNCDTKVGE